jgi:hypothetical protein
MRPDEPVGLVESLSGPDAAGKEQIKGGNAARLPHLDERTATGSSRGVPLG